MNDTPSSFPASPVLFLNLRGDFTSIENNILLKVISLDPRWLILYVLKELTAKRIRNVASSTICFANLTLRYALSRSESGPGTLDIESTAFVFCDRLREVLGRSYFAVLGCSVCQRIRLFLFDLFVRSGLFRLFQNFQNMMFSFSAKNRQGATVRS